MNEFTFGIIKPDAVEKRIVGQILNRIERDDLGLFRVEMRKINVLEATDLYAEHEGRFFHKDLVEFMTSGPSVLLALTGPDVIARWRALMGATNSAHAAAATIRSEFGSLNPKTMYRNAVHGSDSVIAARRELHIFFGNDT